MNWLEIEHEIWITWVLYWQPHENCWCNWKE